MDKREPNAASLGRALKQLEALLEGRARQSHAEKREPPAVENLPVLDDVVDSETVRIGEPLDLDSVALTESLASQPDTEQIRQALQRLSDQIEVELEALVSLLKESMLKEFRQELASVLGVDPQHFDAVADDDNNLPND